MGCSSQKAADIEEGKKDEGKLESMELGNKNEDEVNLENQEKENKNEEELKIENNELENPNEEQLEVVELERPNYASGPNEDEKEPKEAETKNQIVYGGEQEEEIPEDINIEEDEIKELNQNNNLSTSLKKSNLKSSGLTKSKQSLTDIKNTNPQTEGSLEKTKNTKKNMAKGNKNGKNTKNVKKKPFIISEIQKLENESHDSKEDINLYKVKLIINACSFSDEYMMPIWCHKGIYLKFRVEGKWRIDKLYDYTDSKGIPSNHSAGFNYGALVGRIGLEKEKDFEKEKDLKNGKDPKKGKDLNKGTGLINDKEFVVVDEGTIFVKEEGPLFLRQNLPKKLKIEPEGKLDVTIYDGEYMKIDIINQKIGWFENGPIDNNKDKAKSENNNNSSQKIDKNSNNSNQKSEKSSNIKKNVEIEEINLEKDLRTHFSNLRMNPSMYYEKYISINVSLIKTKEYLGKVKKEINPLLVNEDDPCYNFIGEYFKLPNQKQLQNNLNKNKVILNLIKFDEDLSFFLNDQINKTVIVKCILTQKDNPVDVIMQYLLDKKFRKYIFNEHSKTLIIKVLKNYYNNSSLVIVAISIERDDSKEP